MEEGLLEWHEKRKSDKVKDSIRLHRRPTKIDGHRARWLGLTSDDVRSCSWPHVQDEDTTDATASLPAVKVA